MSEMVERVAGLLRDLCDVTGGEDDIAKQIIAAMREPTAEMTEWLYAFHPDAARIENIYVAMIDAALR